MRLALLYLWDFVTGRVIRATLNPQFSLPAMYRWVIRLGDVILALSIAGLIACALLAYWLEHYLSLTSLVVVHIGIIVMAALVKLGYILRLAAVHELNLHIRSSQPQSVQ